MGALITGTGSFIPAEIRSNEDFARAEFYDGDHRRLVNGAVEIIRKFEKITGIAQRRYANDHLNTSDMAAVAAAAAIEDAGVDPETIDQLIVAHNFGDVQKNSFQSDAVPSLASRVKTLLQIVNPSCIAYDLIFGCAGWLQGMIQADAFIRAGMATKCLIIGAETLSRVIDPHDRDSMIFSDGAGAVLLEAADARSADARCANSRSADAPFAAAGIIGSVSQSHALAESAFITLGKSYCPPANGHTRPPANAHTRYLKMQGRKVYEFALRTVPSAMKSCLDACGIQPEQVKKIFLHQANEKMDAAIVKAFYGLFGRQEAPEGIMPMNIRELGNSSVATIPTLFDMVRKAAIPGHQLFPGDIILFASVGAGMNLNAVCYRI